MNAMKKLKGLLIFLLVLPFVIVLRIIRPVIRVRFIDLNVFRIGHCIGNTEVYLAKRDALPRDKKIVDIFYYIPPVCNFQLLKMWKRVIPVTGLRFIYWIVRANRKIPGWKIHEVEFSRGECDVQGLIDFSKQRVFFTQEEEACGQKELRSMGIRVKSPFVCFHARDNAYLAKTYPGYDWSYHDFRDGDINNYSLAIRGLLDRGYSAVRMGSIVKEKFPGSFPGLIDYACSGMRSDFLDLYLSSKCHFFIHSECGLGAVARLFRKPAVCVNQIPMDYMIVWDPNYLVICKKLWLKAEKRLLTFREILKSGIGRLFESGDYVKRGIEIIQNTPEEIRDVSEEMLERLAGRWKIDDEQEALQRRFWSLYETNDLHGVIRARIGSKFLMQNKNLLN